MERTLLLNASFQPIKVVNWRKAVILLYLQKVEVVEVHNRKIRTVTQSFKLPAVIRLFKYTKWKNEKVKLSRETIFQRDHFTCQYCEQRFPSHKLTWDHVIPRSLGGRTSWENIVAACLPCNMKKGNKPLGKVGLKLRKTPIEPDWFNYLMTSLKAEKGPTIWNTYLPN